MADTLPSGLPTGIGNDEQATQVTAWMRQQPWYLQWLQSKGITPGEGDQVKLNEDQQSELRDLLVQHGVGLNHKYDEIDENGQVSEGHHKLKKALIGAAIGGAGLTGLGAFGIGPLAGILGGSTAAGAGGAGAELGADAAGVGATSGLASGAGIGGAFAAPTLADVSGVVAGSGLSGGLGGTLGKAAGLLGGKAGDILGAAGEGLGAATNAAAQNRGAKANLALTSQGVLENELQARAKEEQSQRNDALKQGYYANYVQNRKPGPFNTAGITPYGADTLTTAANLAAQSKAKLANAPQYDTNGMPKLPTPQDFVDEYGNPSTMEKVGNWATPALSTLGKVLKFF